MSASGIGRRGFGRTPTEKEQRRWWVCERKRFFLSYEAAVDYARITYPDEPNLLAYYCPYSGDQRTGLGRHWHVGHAPKGH